MTNELEYIKTKFAMLNRESKLNLLKTSNLNDREISLLEYRLIKGISLKACSDLFNLEIDTINKYQLRAVKKLFKFLKSS